MVLNRETNNKEPELLWLLKSQRNIFNKIIYSYL